MSEQLQLNMPLMMTMLQMAFSAWLAWLTFRPRPPAARDATKAAVQLQETATKAAAHVARLSRPPAAQAATKAAVQRQEAAAKTAAQAEAQAAAHVARLLRPPAKPQGAPAPPQRRRARARKPVPHQANAPATKGGPGGSTAAPFQALGCISPLSGMDASSDERQKLINNLHTLADIALVGDYMRDRVPPRVMALKLQPVDEVYPQLTGEAALDTIKVAERDQQRRVYNTEVMTADAEYEHQQLKAQALMNLWMDYILGPNMQYMLDNYRRK